MAPHLYVSNDGERACVLTADKARLFDKYGNLVRTYDEPNALSARHNGDVMILWIPARHEYPRLKVFDGPKAVRTFLGREVADITIKNGCVEVFPGNIRVEISGARRCRNNNHLLHRPHYDSITETWGFWWEHQQFDVESIGPPKATFLPDQMLGMWTMRGTDARAVRVDFDLLAPFRNVVAATTADREWNRFWRLDGDGACLKRILGFVSHPCWIN